MAEDLIRYDILAQDALRGVIRKVMSEVAKTGLPGNHHFYINFATRFPGVRLPTKLLENPKFAEEMTIVLQNQFWDLRANENGFEVGLSFDNHPELIAIPYASIRAFYDPSVPFRLEFDPATPALQAGSTPAPQALPAAPVAAVEDDAPKGDTPAQSGEKIVSLDSFRKKP